jgi:glycosyltransferase involved in cell wall biosynthesis
MPASNVRVCFVTYVNPDRLPPLINSARLIARSGIALDILALDSGEWWDVDYGARVRVFRLATHIGRLSWPPARGLLRLVEFSYQSRLFAVRNRYRLYVAHDMHSLLVAHGLAALYGGAVAYHCHELVLPSETSGLMRLLKRLEYRLLRRTVFWIVPEFQRGRLIMQASSVQHKPYVVANCPLLAPYQRTSRLKDVLSEQGRFYSRIVLRQGIMGSGHSVEETIRSVPLWSDSTWGLVFLGYAASDFVERMEQVACALGIQDRVVFLPPVSYDQVLDYTRSADVGLAIYKNVSANHRYSGTASNKLFEYMSAGLPVIASNRPILEPIVKTYNTGKLVDPGDPGSIADAVNAILSDPEEYRVMSDRAYQLFRSTFHYEAQFAPVLAEIQRILVIGIGHE